MLNTLISSGYSLINAQLHPIAPTCSSILNIKYYKQRKIWIPSWKNILSRFRSPLKIKRNILTRNRKKTYDKIDKIDKWMENLMDKFENSSPNKAETNKTQNSFTVVRTTRKVTALEGGNYHKIGLMWTLKHEISSPKFYELIIKTDLKGGTVLDINNFYNHIKIYLNEVNRP